MLYVIDSPSFFTSVRKGTNDTRSWVSEIESLLAVDDSFLATSITCFTYFCFLRIFPLFWCLCVVYTSLDHIRPNIYNYASLAVPHLCSSRVKSSIYSIANLYFAQKFLLLGPSTVFPSPASLTYNHFPSIHINAFHGVFWMYPRHLINS